MRGCSQLALCYHYLHQHCYLFLYHLLHQLKHVLPAEFDSKILPLRTARASTFKLPTQHLADATARQHERLTSGLRVAQSSLFVEMGKLLDASELNHVKTPMCQ